MRPKERVKPTARIAQLDSSIVMEILTPQSTIMYLIVYCVKLVVTRLRLVPSVALVKARTRHAMLVQKGAT